MYVYRWAWQHTGNSRHVENVTLDSTTSATGKTMKPHRRRTRRSLKAHLEDLHALLRSTYFSTWPLRVRFFSADVHRAWKAWDDRVDETLPNHVQIILDGDCVVAHDTDDTVGNVYNIKNKYTVIEDYLEKAAFLLDDPTDLHCRICQGRVIPHDELVVVCPQTECHCISHMSCLSAKFLAAGDSDQFVPLHGTCPACEKRTQWSVIMQELTLRRRGDKERRTILRRKQRRQNQNQKKKTGASSQSGKTQNSRLDETNSSDDSANDEPLDENWVEEMASESDSDTGSRSKTWEKPPAPQLEIVIEDSEGE